MIIVRILGWFLFFVAALFVVRDVTGAIGTDHGFKPKTVADLWNLLSPGAVDNFEGWVMMKYGHRMWWVASVALSCWASIACFVPGLICELLGRPYVDRPYKRVPRKTDMQHHR